MTQRPSAIRDELLRLAKLHGGELRPEAVVEAARPTTSPLHDSFEWRDSAAAQQWRIQQARMLIRVVVKYEAGRDGEEVECRVFVSLTPDRKANGAGYRVMTTVLSNAEYRAQLLADARAEMQVFREKYRALTELAAVFAAMKSVGVGSPAGQDAPLEPQPTA